MYTDTHQSAWTTSSDACLYAGTQDTYSPVYTTSGLSSGSSFYSSDIDTAIDTGVLTPSGGDVYVTCDAS
jgi:hypothetical protein